jgi:hypothetical protein
VITMPTAPAAEGTKKRRSATSSVPKRVRRLRSTSCSEKAGTMRAATAKPASS